MIKFVKLDETFIKIVCEKSTLEEISDKFKFVQKNYQYTPQGKRGWDGVIKLINTKSGNFLSGLLKEVILKFKELGYHQFSFEGFEKSASEYTENGILEALDAFKLPDGVEIYEHQLNAILTSLLGQRRLIVSPTSSGKSLIIYSIIRILIESGKKILLITPTTMLVDQLLKDFQDYEVNDDFGIEDYSHKVYAGLNKTSEKPLIISTWQSIDSVPKENLVEFLSEYDAVLTDECHLAQAKSLRNILEKSVNAKIKVGFTGTLIDTPTHYYVLIGLFGTPKKVISIKELMDTGKIARLTIKCIVLQYPEDVRKQVHKFVDRNKNIRPMEYDEELEFIINYENRNKFIANLADKLEGNTLTIIRFIEKHANVLKDYYDAKNNKKTFLITGDVKHDEKTLIKENMEFETNANLMGSWGLVSTGMSIINLHNGIFASPSASEIRVLQAIGRLLRKGKNKTSATQYDIIDDLTYEGRYNYMMRHFQQRLNYYRREGFDVQIIKVNMQ